MTRHAYTSLRSRFQSDGKCLSPCLDYTIKQSKCYDLLGSVTEEVVECLIAKTRLGPLYFSQEVLWEAKEFLNDKSAEYLRAAIAHRQSILARLHAKYDDADALTKQYPCFSNPRCQNDRRLHAWHLHLFVSHLKILNLQEKFEAAREELEKWNQLPKISLMEYQSIPIFAQTASEVWRSFGKLKHAKGYLTDCYCLFSVNDENPFLKVNDPHRYQIICALIDIHCALGEIEEAASLAGKEIGRLLVDGRLSKAFRRLQVLSLEIDIARASPSSLTQARTKALFLENFFRGIQEPDISDQLLQVRTHVASARVLHLQSYFSRAIQEWESVKALAGTYSAFKCQGFTFAFSQLSISLAHFEIARRANDSHAIKEHDQAFAETLQQANSIFQREDDNYWIPTITTDWLPKVRSEIESLTGHRVVKKGSQG